MSTELTIARLRISNFKCLRGVQTLDLEPKLYGIYARHARNEKRSNALGKSALCEAIDYALTGRLPRDCRLKKDWISHGESGGYVEVVFSTGDRVERRLSAADSEKLFFFPAGDPERGATQGAAQEKIDALLGLSRDDAATWSFRQDEMSDLLTMDPAPRLEKFAAWFGLEALEEAQAASVSACGEIERAKGSWRGNLAGAEHAARQLLGPGDFAELLSGLDAVIATYAREAEAAQKKVEAARARAGQVAEHQGLARDAARYDAVVESGKALAARLKDGEAKEKVLLEERDALVAKRPALAEEEALARADAGAVARVEGASFDGVCPVAGAGCPAAGFVTESVVRNRARGENARGRLRRAADALAAATFRVRQIDAELQAPAADRRRLSELRAAAKELKPRRDRWEELSAAAPANADLELSLAQTEHANAARRLADANARRRLAADALRNAEAARAEIARLEEALVVPAAAAVVFERARREIAEGILRTIEGYANEMLDEFELEHLPLRVRITWAREGSGLADACGGCGAAFPSSRKVRACARCGAERGQKFAEKLDITPSRRSGAADDFGGVAVSLGASRWLREDRASAWATTTIDEATAKMDASNRVAFASHLPAVLRMAGFAQALVVSHHRETLEVLPGRIEIVSEDGCSTVRVIA